MANSQWVVSPICYSTAPGLAEVRVRITVRLNFCKLSFRNCISCVLNCDDLLCIYFATSQLQYSGSPITPTPR